MYIGFVPSHAPNGKSKIFAIDWTNGKELVPITTIDDRESALVVCNYLNAHRGRTPEELDANNKQGVQQTRNWNQLSDPVKQAILSAQETMIAQRRAAPFTDFDDAWDGRAYFTEPRSFLSDDLDIADVDFSEFTGVGPRTAYVIFGRLQDFVADFEEHLGLLLWGHYATMDIPFLDWHREEDYERLAETVHGYCRRMIAQRTLPTFKTPAEAMVVQVAADGMCDYLWDEEKRHEWFDEHYPDLPRTDGDFDSHRISLLWPDTLEERLELAEAWAWVFEDPWPLEKEQQGLIEDISWIFRPFPDPDDVSWRSRELGSDLSCFPQS